MKKNPFDVGKHLHCLKKFLLVMKLTAFFLLFFFFSVSAYTQKVTLSVKSGGTLNEVLRQIKDQAGVRILYNAGLMKSVKCKALNIQELDVREALRLVLAETPFVFFEEAGVFIVRETVKEDQKKSKLVRVKGRVRDEKKSPLPGVTIRLKGTTVGTTTRVDGTYGIDIPKDSSVLIFSFLGMKTVEIKYKGQDSINVTMKEEATMLKGAEVVSTGYYNVDRRHLTSAVTTLKMDDIMIPGMSTIDQMLEGHVPGMIFMQNSGQVGAAPKLRIRGTSTLLSSQEPLWVLDGVVLTEPVDVDPQQLNDLDFVNLLGNAISGLNPEDIEQIDVLKDASATAIYGPRAANGVMVITTKKGKIGKPRVSYSLTSGFRRRPRYSDRGVNVMNSRERIQFSRDLYQAGQTFPSGSTIVGYELALQEYFNQKIDYAEFKRRVGYYETINTDWLGILLEDAFSHSHTLSVSGGTENLRYYASIGYNDEAGNIRKESNKRYSTTANINLNYNKFTLSFGLNANVQKKKYTPEEVGIMNYAYYTSRAVPAYNEDGSLWFYERPKTTSRWGGIIDTFQFSILNERDNSEQSYLTNSLSLNTRLGYQITSAWSTALTLAYSTSNTNDQTWYGEKSFYAANLRGSNYGEDYISTTSLLPFGGELKESDSRNETYSVRWELTWRKFLDEGQKHHLSASLFGDLSSSRIRSMARTYRGYMPERGMTMVPIDPNGSINYRDFIAWRSTDKNALGVRRDNLTNQLAGVLTVMYSYNDIYMLNGNMRIDASNKFGDQSNDKLLPIWSVSGRWNIKEDLFSEKEWINDLAFRASFGWQGNMVSTESPEMIIEKGTLNNMFGEFESTIHKFPNPNLKWEKTVSVDGSVEFALFRNKLVGSIGYYYRKTKDAYISSTVSYVNGVNSYIVNKGTLTNSGFEFSFNFIPIDNAVSSIGAGGEYNGFVWRIDPQFGSVLNQLVDKLKGKDKVLQDEVSYEDYLNGNVQVAGRPVNTFYSYKFKGLSHEDGHPLFYGTDRYTEVNGEQVPTEDIYSKMTKDEMYMTVMEHSGCRQPFLQGSVSNTFSYKRFTLSFNLAYSIGSKVRLFQLYTGSTAAPSPEQNLGRVYLDRWQRPGDEKYTNIPAIPSEELWRATTVSGGDESWWLGSSNAFAGTIWKMYDNSDVRVASGDYLKLQSLSLRYNVPTEFCKRLRLKSAYLSFSTSNLFTICSSKLKGQEPTQSGSSSTINIKVPAAFNFRLNVTF